jgi:hypothetical protein
MNRQEFISRQEAMTRGTNNRVAHWITLFFAALLGAIPLPT